MAKNITKKDLVIDVAAMTGVPADSVKEVIEAFMGQIKANLALHRTIEIRGFGTFSLQHRKRRPARNIHTGAVVPIAERYVPTLRFCDAFRKRTTMTEVLPEE